MTAMHVKIGDSVKFSKTVGESDVYLFAGLTGDLTLGADGRVHREPAWVRITRSGEPQLLTGATGSGSE